MLQVLFSATSLVLLLATALGLAIRRVFFSGLWSVPGPFVARLTDLWYAYRVLRGRFEKDNVELHRKYGALVPAWSFIGDGWATWPAYLRSVKLTPPGRPRSAVRRQPVQHRRSPGSQCHLRPREQVHKVVLVSALVFPLSSRLGLVCRSGCQLGS